jgi:CDP-diacylglycerol--serine O-phosphatidyltransferase
MMTATNLILGFLAIIFVFNDSLALKLGQETHELPFVWSGRLILFAIFFDMMDGRLARATGATSRFGVEFDSMADMVSFGMAPAVIDLRVRPAVPARLAGHALAVLYVVCAAVPWLAQRAVGRRGEGQVHGIAHPAAAGLVASYVLLSRWSGWGDHGLVSTVMTFYETKINVIETLMVPLFTALVAFLMVSTVRYPSMKKLNWEKVKASTLVFVGLGLYFLFAAPEFTAFFLLFTNLMWGLLGGPLEGELRSTSSRPDPPHPRQDEPDPGGPCGPPSQKTQPLFP